MATFDFQSHPEGTELSPAQPQLVIVYFHSASTSTSILAELGLAQPQLVPLFGTFPGGKDGKGGWLDIVVIRLSSASTEEVQLKLELSLAIST